MRPRCCLRYLTFFGINIEFAFVPLPTRFDVDYCWFRTNRCDSLKGASGELWFAFLLGENFSFIDPALHADRSVRRASFAESVFDVGTQRVQRQPSLQIPFRAGDFVAVQS